MNVVVNQHNEFIASIENAEELLRQGASYHMAECPQAGINLLRWDLIDKKLTEGINLRNCPCINTCDDFILGDEKYYPISRSSFEMSAQQRYDKNNTKRVSLKLNVNTDTKILDWLGKQKSVQGAIKEALNFYLESIENNK